MGLCVGFFICYGSTNIRSSLSWRLPFAILSVLAFSFSLAALWLTPSPRWLTLHGRTAEAAATWDILGVSHAEREKIEIVEHIREITELEEISASRPATAQNTHQEEKKKNSFWELFTHDVRGRTFLAVFMMGMQQLSGIDGVLYVSTARLTACTAANLIVCPPPLPTSRPLIHRSILPRFRSLCSGYLWRHYPRSHLGRWLGPSPQHHLRRHRPRDHHVSYRRSLRGNCCTQQFWRRAMGSHRLNLPVCNAILPLLGCRYQDLRCRNSAPTHARGSYKFGAWK